MCKVLRLLCGCSVLTGIVPNWPELWELLAPLLSLRSPRPDPLDSPDMTTGECCHLPGSLCECTGNAALSKTVEESDNRRAQYVTQVTAKDGRLLSTVIKALGTQRYFFHHLLPLLVTFPWVLPPLSVALSLYCMPISSSLLLFDFCVAGVLTTVSSDGVCPLWWLL